MALEWARHGIRVNALAPGYILTDLNRELFAGEAGKAMIRRIPQRRLGEPADLDGPLLLLASDVSRYMTGAVLVVDGGHLQSAL
jgi:NAD(P)-dependent dehydrogenase (short-subunit alcohol dehydrogenase family)